MSPTELQLSTINKGRVSQLLLEQMGPMLSEQRDTVLHKLKNLYRSGTHTEAALLAGVAELCSIDDLISRLNQDIESARTVSNEVENGK